MVTFNLPKTVFTQVFFAEEMQKILMILSVVSGDSAMLCRVLSLIAW